MSQTILPADLGRIFADPAAYADPVAWHQAARQLRQEAPISRVSLPEYQDFWAITRHADIMEIERNSAVFTNAPIPTILPRAAYEAQRANTAPPAVNTLIQMDGDEHKAHRGIVNDWFKPASIKRMSDRIDALAKEWVDRMAAMGGQCDFANDIAMHYPLQVILSILGLPEDDHKKMLKLTQELFGAEDPDIGRVSEDATVLDVMLDFVNYFTGLASDRRAHPTEDLASVIANAELDGAPLPDMDVMGFYLIIATAGHDTTSNSIAGGLLALIEHPDQLELLQSDPSALRQRRRGADPLRVPGEALHADVSGALHRRWRGLRARRCHPALLRLGQSGRRSLRGPVPAGRAPTQCGVAPRLRVRSPLLPRRPARPHGSPCLLPGTDRPAGIDRVGR